MFILLLLFKTDVALFLIPGKKNFINTSPGYFKMQVKKFFKLMVCPTMYIFLLA